MKRILITVEYDGSRYSGWQKQPSQKTIQGEIEEALFKALGQRIEIFGSGRTDAGVHALNQKAHFDLNVPVPVSKLPQILNSILPEDICIKEACEVDKDFHARFSQKKKYYQYKILNSLRKDAFLAYRVGKIKEALDINKMKACANMLIGEHDFQGFCSANTCSENFVRTIYNITVEKKEDFIIVTVCGNGFLYNMVRIIVGTLVDYSLGLRDDNDILEALSTGNRQKAGRTMPAGGLYLKDVDYN